MLMMTQWRQWITGGGENFDTAALAFVDPRMRCDGSRRMRGIEFGIGQVGQVMKILVLRHLALARLIDRGLFQQVAIP